MNKVIVDSDKTSTSIMLCASEYTPWQYGHECDNPPEIPLSTFIRLVFQRAQSSPFGGRAPGYVGSCRRDCGRIGPAEAGRPSPHRGRVVRPDALGLGAGSSST
jgi:hypothetical protein